MKARERVIAQARRVAALDGTDRLQLREPLAALDAEERLAQTPDGADSTWYKGYQYGRSSWTYDGWPFRLWLHYRWGRFLGWLDGWRR